MSQSPLHRLLDSAWIYAFTQRLWYRRGQQQAYVDAWVRPRPGNRILDVGCGPAAILARMPPVHYVGYEPNPRYAAQAARHFKTRGIFRCGYLTQLPTEEKKSFDIVLANGVLHHLSDDQARQLIALAWEALKPGGRMVTRDGCFEEGQSWAARMLLRNDRGAFVRTPQDYEALFRGRFHRLRKKILRNALRLPYSLIHFEAVKA